MSLFKKTRTIVDIIDQNTGLNTNADKQYLLLLIPAGQEDNTTGEFVALKGRQDTYRYCNDYLISGGYDILRSQILSEGINFGKEVSLYTFIRLAIEHYKYDSIDQLDYLNQVTSETYIEPDKLTPEYLERFYNQECRKESR